MNNPLRPLLLLAFLGLCQMPLFAQADPPATGKEVPAEDPKAQRSVVLPPFDRSTVWEAVRIKTMSLFEEKDVTPRFKIKSDKDARRLLIEALEGQFQVNIGDHEIRSLKRADDLTDYIFEAQQGFTMFSKAYFQGKVERLSSPRKSCKEDGDCINFIGSLIVPKGMVLTMFSQPNFKGEQLVVDATAEERRIESFFDIPFGSTGISTTSRVINWREEVRSVKMGAQKK